MLFCRLLIFFQNELFRRLLILFKINFSIISLRNTIIRVSNSLDPDQARHFVGPDLDPNCLQKLSADDSKQIFKLLCQ